MNAQESARGSTAEAALDPRRIGLTALTVLLGMQSLRTLLPLLVFIGGDFWPPLAIVIAGGVAGATLIALVWVPAAYLLLGDSRRGRAAESGPALVLSEAA